MKNFPESVTAFIHSLIGIRSFYRKHLPGTDGQLTLNQDGYAIEKYTYDKRGNETSRAFFGTDEEPILMKCRFSRYEVQYDDKGNLHRSFLIRLTVRYNRLTDIWTLDLLI